MRRWFAAINLVVVCCSFGQGTITGFVRLPDGSALTGATVMIEDTPFGTMTNSEGYYVIAAVMPGSYSLTSRMIGCSSETVQGVIVEDGSVSRIDFQLTEDVAGSTTIRIVETRAHVLRDVPSTVYALDLSDMNVMTAGGVLDILSEQPGVSTSNGELHVRGGRSDEIDYVLDGVSLRSPMDSRLGIDLPASAVSEAVLITGGMGIEYGNSMSGVVELIPKEGTTEFSASVSGKHGDVTSLSLPSEVQVFSESLDRDYCRTGFTGLEFSLSGGEPVSGALLPELGDKLTFSLSGHMNFSGNGEDTRGYWSNNWLNDAGGLLKLYYAPSIRTSVSLSILGSYRENGWNQWAWSKYEERYCGDGIACPEGNTDFALPVMYSETEGAVLNAGTLLGDKAYLSISLGALRFLNWNRIYDPEGGYVGEDEGYLFWIDEYQHPDFIVDSAGFFHRGIHGNVWFDSRADVFSADIGLDWNPNPRFRGKFGFGGKYYDLYQYSVYCPAQGLSYVSLWNAWPYSGSVYTQGSYRFSGGGILSFGVRGDYFNANTSYFSPESDSADVGNERFDISPRASFSVPFGERSLFYTTYGKYIQIASMNCYYLQSTYATGAEQVVAGNPGLEPEVTTMYEVGIRHEIDRFTDLTLSFYSKDITGLISTQSTSEGDYYIFSNDDSHGNATGIDVTMLRRQGANVSGRLFYCYSTARGRYSDMLDEWNLSQSEGEAVFLEDNYLDWDQPHKAGVSIGYSFFQGEGFSLAGAHPLERTAVEASCRYASGTPYTLLSSGADPVQVNAHRRPHTMQTDISVTRRIPTSLGNVSVSLAVFNLLNRRNIVNLYDETLFHETGNPEGNMGNPRAWAPVRHFFIAASISW